MVGDQVNTRTRGQLRLALILSIIVMSGCIRNNPTPTPPAVQVANSVNALAQTLNAATTGLIAARDAGDLSQEDITIAFRVITTIATVGKEINAELRSTDSWDVQRAQILRLITAASLPALSAQLPPKARAIMLAGLTLFNSISVGVGGPTI
jgi:hypothetical protein